MNATRRTGILLALATAAISGFSVFVNASGVKTFGSATVYTTAKNVVAAAGAARRRSPSVARTGAPLARPAGRRQWLALAAIGVIGGSVPFVLFFEGLARATSPQAAFIHKTLVLWVALLALPLLKERLQWGALGGDRAARRRPGRAGRRAAGLVRDVRALMILAATLLWSVEVVVAKWLLRDVSSWVVAVARMALGSVALLLWLAVRGQLGGLASMTGEQLGWVLATGLLLACYVATWFAALARAQAVDVTAVLVLAAPVTAGLSAAANGTAWPRRPSGSRSSSSAAPSPCGWVARGSPVRTRGGRRRALGSRRPSA